MSDAVPELSAVCARSDHDRCPHWAGVRPRLWRRQPVLEVRLCRCPCHAQCPVAAEVAVTQEVWATTCTCPGAERSRRSFERGREMRRIVAEVDFSDHPDAAEIESRLRAVFAEHGQSPPRGLLRSSGLIGAATARRGTRRPRLLLMGGRAVGTTVRWSHGKATSGEDAENRSQMRSAYRLVGVVATVATAMTVAALASTGWRRLVWGVLATLAWLGSGYAVSVVTAIASIARSAEAQSRAQDLPSR